VCERERERERESNKMERILLVSSSSLLDQPKREIVSETQREEKRSYCFGFGTTGQVKIKRER